MPIKSASKIKREKYLDKNLRKNHLSVHRKKEKNEKVE